MFFSRNAKASRRAQKQAGLRAWGRPRLEALEDRLAPAVLGDYLLAPLQKGPTIPIASSVLQQKQTSDLIDTLVVKAFANYALGKSIATPNGDGTETIIVDPVQATANEQADFSLPLGSFLTLSTLQKVNVNLVADYVMVLVRNTTTKVTTIADLDDHVRQLPHHGTLPSSTLTLGVSANLPTGFTATGDMKGELFVTARDQSDTSLNGTFEIATSSIPIGRFDPPFVLPDPAAVSAGFAAANPVATLTGRAFGDFVLTIDTSPNPEFNKIPFNVELSAGLLANWTFDKADVTSAADSPLGTLDPVQLRSVTFDLGTVTTAIGGIIEQIQGVTKLPGIAQFVDLFGTKIDLVNVSIGDLLLPAYAAQTIDAVHILNHIDVTPQSGQLKVGSFTIYDALDPAKISVHNEFDVKGVDDPELIAVLNTALGTLFGQGDDPTIGLHFPIFADPAGTLDRILTGKQADLATFETPAIDLDFSPPLDGLISDLGVGLSGGIHIHFQASVGIDTGGFYIDQRGTQGVIDGELVLKANFGVSAEGGIYAKVRMHAAGTPDLNDPNKRRLDDASPIAASGKVYIAASVGVLGYNPVDIAYKELLNFRNDPDRLDTSLPVEKRESSDHVLMLDTSLIQFGDVVTVKPFVNRTISDDDDVQYSGIEVDYSDRTVIYVEARDGEVTNYYDTIGIGGELPGGGGVRILDPFGVFAKMKVDNPSSATPRVVLVGGGSDDLLEFQDDGNGAQVLLVGGGNTSPTGSDTLEGGQLMFADNVPAAWDDAAAPYLPPDLLTDTPADLAAKALLRQRIHDAIVSSGHVLFVGIRDGTMVGGAGRNDFQAEAAGSYKFYGGTNANTFRVSPTFDGARATYLIHGGGPGSTNTLLIVLGHDKTIPADKTLVLDVEAADIADDLDSTKKALVLSDADGDFAIAHGIGSFDVQADSETNGTEIGLGDTSETAVTSQRIETDRVPDRTKPIKTKYLGSSGDDVFTVTPSSANSSGTNLGKGTPAKLTVARYYGKSGKTVTTVSTGLRQMDPLEFDGGKGADTYDITLGSGTYFDTAITDVNDGKTNTLNVNGFAVFDSYYFSSYLRLDKLTATDDTLEFDYHSPPTATYVSSAYFGGVVYTSLPPVYYAPKVKFDANVSQVNVNTQGAFRDIVVNRPVAPQALAIQTAYAPERWYNASLYNGGYFPDEVIQLAPNVYHGNIDVTHLFDVVANGGVLDVTSAVSYPYVVRSNSGTLTLNLDTQFGNSIDILGNSGTINVEQRRTGWNAYSYESDPDTITLGSNGSLAGVGGTIHLGGFNTAEKVIVDDSSNPTGGRAWKLNATQLATDDGFTLDYLPDAPVAGTDPFRILSFVFHTGHDSTVTYLGKPPINAPYHDTVTITTTTTVMTSTGTKTTTTTTVPGAPQTPMQITGGPNSTLQGPNQDNSWDISGHNAGTLNELLQWFDFANLRGGAKDDTFTMRDAGSVSGTIDGGDGIDALSYSHVTTPYFANLALQSAGGVGKKVINVEYVTPDPLVLILGAAGYSEGDSVSIAPDVSSLFGGPHFTASGLPSWLSFDPASGMITGTVPFGAADHSPFAINYAVSDDFGNVRSEALALNVSGVPFDFAQAFTEGDTVDFTPTFPASFGTLYFSATQLPSWLSIDMEIGRISGTVPSGTAESSPFSIGLGVNDTFGNLRLGSFTLYVSSAPVITPYGGDGQPAVVSTEYAAPLAVKVTDAAGKPLENVTVYFSVDTSTAAGATFPRPIKDGDDIGGGHIGGGGIIIIGGGGVIIIGGGGGIPFAAVATDADGIATSPTLTANEFAGTFVVTADVDNENAPVVFHLTNVSPEEDVTPPTTEIIPYIDPLTTDTEAYFEFAGTDDLTPFSDLSFEYRLDDDPTWTPVEPPLVIRPGFIVTPYVDLFDLPDGTHTLHARAIDTGGNVDPNPAAFTWIIDTTPPVLHLPANVRAAAKDSAGAKVLFDDATAEDASGTVTFEYSQASGTLFAVGTTTVSVTATDALGHQSSGTFDVTVIDDAPVAMIDVNPQLRTRDTSAHFEFSASDTLTPAADLVFETKLDDGDWQIVSAIAQDFDDLAEGPHVFSVRATNAAGATSEAVSASWTIDLTPPALTVPGDIVVEATGATGAKVVFPAPVAADADQMANVTTDKASGTLFGLGATTIHVAGVDTLGNSITMSFTVTVQDTTPPVIRITEKPAPFTARTDAHFEFSVTDAVWQDTSLRIGIRLDDGVVVEADTSLDFTNLSDGKHTLTVFARDGSGNVSDEVSYSWEIDATPPTLYVPPAMTVEATVPGGAFLPFDPIASDPNLARITTNRPTNVAYALGATVVSTLAIDSAGNYAQKSMIIKVQDTTPPVVSFVSGPDSGLRSTLAFFQVSATDTATLTSDLIVETSLDGQGWQPAEAGKLKFGGLTVGNHTLDVRTTDQSGNVGSASWDWSIREQIAAMDDTASMPQDSSVVISVLSNDGYGLRAGEVLSLVSVGAAAHGTATVEGQDVRYTPDAGFMGTDTFSYSVKDNKDGFATATVSVTVTSSNHPPVIAPLDRSGTEGQAVTFSDMVSDADLPAQRLTYFWLVTKSGSLYAGGTSPTFAFVPDDDGTYLVTLTASDGFAETSRTGTVTVANADPTAAVSVASIHGINATFTLTAADPSPVDQSAGFTFGIDWDGNGTIDQTVTGPSGTKVSHLFVKSTPQDVTVVAADKDGGVSAKATPTAGTAKQVGNELIITGTDGDDEITVRRDGPNGGVQVSIDGFPLATQYAGVAQIVINGLGGDDRIIVGAGITQPATIDGGDGDDYIQGGAGDDTIDGGAGDNEIHSGGGNDTVRAGDGDNMVWTDGAKDSITLGDGNNEVHAGGDSDVVTLGNGDNKVWTGRGNDTVRTGDGDNEIRAGQKGNDTITTGGGNDLIYGGAGDDVIDAGDGNNTVFAGSGDDIVRAGAGKDYIDGGEGDDLIRSGAGNDTVYGGAGDDILLGGDGNDALYGEGGRDLLIGGNGGDLISGGEDNDILIAGTTSYDANDQALAGLLGEWTGKGSYAVRIARMESGGGRLDGADGPSQTVFNDTDVDTLWGNGGQDWFLADRIADDSGPLDIFRDLAKDETWSDTDF